MRIFTKKHLESLGLPSSAISNKIVDSTRWSIVSEIIFNFEDKFYQTTYSVGATEQQDEGPWEYDNEIECYEVELKSKQIYVWERI